VTGPKVARRVVGQGGGWSISPGADLTAIHDNPTGTVVGTMAIVTRDRVAASTAMSWMLTDLGFLGPGEVLSRQIVIGHILTLQRNECVQRMEGDWILFIDDDMVWQPGAVRTLVETQRKYDLDIVGGLCFQRGAPHQPTLYYRDGPTGNYNFREEWPEDTALEVDATGMAFTLIHKRVFERVLGEPMPTLEERAGMPPPPFFKWTGQYGEDFLFCQEAKAAGCQIFVDTSVKIGHIAEVVVTEDSFNRELAFRSEEAWQARIAQNDRMGLPTVGPKEAFYKVRRT
jgi:GT2 family glycosyltransferase